MKEIKKNIIDYLHIARKALTLILFLSVSFYTAFRVAKWNSDSIQLFFDNCYDIFDVIKANVSLLLLGIESVLLINGIIKREKHILRDLFIFGSFIFACLCFKVFTYYERFIYYAIIIYFSRYLMFKSLMIEYVVIYSISLLTKIFGNISGNLSTDIGLRGLNFGFIHYNSAALFLFMYYLSISYLLKEKKTLITVIGIIVELILALIIKSRTPFIVTAIFIALLWGEGLYCKFPMTPKIIIKYCFILMPILLTLLSFVLGQLIYDGVLAIDGNASCRFYEFIYFMKERGLSLSYCEMGELKRTYYFDNGYGHLLFHYGLVSYAIITFGQLLSNYSATKNNDYFVAIMMICLYVYNLMEFILYFNDLPLLMIAYMSRLFINKEE